MTVQSILCLLLRCGGARGAFKVDMSSVIAMSNLRALEFLFQVGGYLAQNQAAMKSDHVDGHAVCNEALYSVVQCVGFAVNAPNAIDVKTGTW